MSLDERDYMQERVPARLGARLDDESAGEPACAAHRKVRARWRAAQPHLFVGLIALLALASGWLSARDPDVATGPVVPGLPLAQGAVAPLEAGQPPAGEPETSLAPTWTPQSASGRLVVMSAPGVPGSTIRISRRGLSWDGYVRSGQTASLELPPGTYALEVLPPEGAPPSLVVPALVIASPTSTVTLRVPAKR